MRGPCSTPITPLTGSFFHADPHTKCDDMLPIDSEDRLGPWAILLPSYNNVAELKQCADVLGLDPTLNDEELMAQAAERGLMLDSDEKAMAEARLAARAAGLAVEVYKGKIAAGCAMEAVVSPLMQAGIRTGQMCKTKKKDETTGQVEPVYCDHYVGCPAIAQRERVKTAHVVIMVQNFLTLAIPEELKKIRGVVLDKRILHLVLHGTTMKAATLEIARREPTLTKHEKDAAVSYTHLTLPTKRIV